MHLSLGLKKHAGLPDKGERRFRGWSGNGHRAFVELIGKIKNDVSTGEYGHWERLMKVCHAENVANEQASEVTLRKYVVDRTFVWEL